MSDSLNVTIKALLDEASTDATIKKQLEKLRKNWSVKVNFDLKKEIVSSLKELVATAERYNKTLVNSQALMANVTASQTQWNAALSNTTTQMKDSNAILSQFVTLAEKRQELSRQWTGQMVNEREAMSGISSPPANMTAGTGNAAQTGGNQESSLMQNIGSSVSDFTGEYLKVGITQIHDMGKEAATTAATTTALAGAARVAGIAIRGLMASTVVGAAFAALSWVVEGLVSSFSKADEAHKKLMLELEQGYQQTEQTIQRLEVLNEKMKSLQASGDSSPQYLQNIANVQKEIASILPETLQYYDAEGKAVYATASQVDELIDKYTKLNAARAKAISNSMFEDTKEDARQLKELYNQQSELQKKLIEEQGKQNALKFIQDFKEREIGTYQTINDHGNKGKKNVLYAGVQSILDGSNVDKDGDKFARKAIDGGIEKSLEESRSIIGEIEAELATAEENISKHTDNFVQKFKASNTNLLAERNIQNQNVRIILNDFADSFVQSNKITDENHAVMIDTYRKQSAQIIKLHEEGKIDLTKLYDLDNLQVIKTEFEKARLPVDNIIDLMETASQSVPSASDQLSQAYKRLGQSVQQATQEISPLDKLLDDIANGQTFNSDTMTDLLLKYPELTSAVYQSGDAWGIEQSAVEALRSAKIQLQLDSIAAEKGLTDSILTEMGSRLEAYGIELESITDLKTAREAALKIKSSIPPEPSRRELPDRAQEHYKVLEKDADGLENYGQFLELRKKLTELLNSRKLGNPKEKPGGKPSQPVDLTTIQRVDDTEEIIKGINQPAANGHKSNERLDEQFQKAVSSKDYAKLNKLYDDLTKGRSTEIIDLQKANNSISEKATGLKSAYQNNKKKMVKTAASPDQWFDDNNEATLEYTNLMNRYASESVRIKSSKLTDVKKAEQLKALKTEKEEVEKLFSVLQKLKQAYAGNSEQIHGLRSAMDEAAKSVKELREEQQKQAEEQTKQDEEAAAQRHEKWLDGVEAAADKAIEAYKAYYEQRRDYELDLIEQAKKAEDERHDNAMDNLDKEMKAYAESVRQLMGDMDRANEEEDYRHEFVKKQQDIAKVKQEIALLSQDDSAETRSRVTDLQQQLSEKEEALAKFSRDRATETVKQGLEDLISNKEKEIELRKEQENEEHEIKVKGLENDIKEEEKKWRALLEDEQKFQQMRKDIIAGNLTSINEEIGKFTAETNSMMSTIGVGIADNLISKLEEAQRQINEVTRGAEALYGETKGDALRERLQAARGTAEYNEAVYGIAPEKTEAAIQQVNQAFDTYQGNKSWAEQKKALERAGKVLTEFHLENFPGMQASVTGQELIEQIKKGDKSNVQSELERASKVYFLKMALGKKEEALEAGKWADYIRSIAAKYNTGGYTGNWGGSEGKLAILHQKEYVLNPQNFQTMLSSMKLANDFASRIKLPNFNGFSTSDHSSKTVKIDKLMHIESVSNAADFDIRKLVRNGLDEVLRMMGGQGFTINYV